MINLTGAARQLYQQEVERQMQILENVHIRELKPVLNRQYLRAAQAVQQGMLDVDFAVDKDGDRLRGLLSRHYRRIAAVFSEKVFKVIEESQKSLAIPEIKGPKEEFWGELNRWMSTEAGRKIRHIQDTTKRNIARTIRKGMEEGESHRTIAKRVRKTGRISTVRRAVTIARTETHTASVKSVDSAIGSTRILMEREWVSARDDRTRSRIRKDRFEHYLKFPAGPDGEKVAQEGKFTKTGEALSYPGDPSASPGNSVNCRCVLLYKPVRRTERLKPYEPEPGYVPAKTVEGAEAWALGNIQGLKKASLKGFDVKQANSVNSELSILQNKHGKLGRLEGIEVKDKSFGLAGRMRGAKVLEIREDITDDFLIRLQKAGVDGWENVNPGLAGLVDHEIGHTFTPDVWKVVGPRGATELTAFGKRLDKFFEANKDRIRKQLSEYAASARHEFVAEAFAMREAGTAPKWAKDWLTSEGIGK